MAPPHPPTIIVNPPEVRGDKVTFSWTHPGGFDLQRRHRWTVRYVGVRLASTPRAVLWDVFLALQLRVWRGAGAIRVVLPEGVDRRQVEWWTAFHGATDVEIITTGEPVPAASVTAGDPGRVAVSFGGGKDSSLALAVLRSSRRRSDLVPVHVVQHFRNARRTRWATIARSLALVVVPTMVTTRTPVRVVTNDFLSTLTTAGRRHSPHINFYGPALLPLIMATRTSTMTFSRTAAGYRATPRKDGSLRFSNPTGRRESLEAMSRYVETVHGYPISFQGTHQAVSELVSYATLLRLDPQAARSVVMCMRTTRLRRWCLTCSKCLEYGLFSLACGFRDPRFDYETAFTSPRAQDLAAAARRAGTATNAYGVAPFDPAIGTKTHFAAFCHALHLVGARLGRDRLQATPGLRNLAAMHDAWGRRPFAGAASLDPAAVAASGDLSQEVATVAARWAPVVAEADLGDDEPRMLVGDEPGSYDHSAVMPTPRLDAWHERWSGAAR